MWKPIAFCLILVSALCQAEIYKWVNDQGAVHFSDRKPDAGSFEQIETGPINSYESVSIGAAPEHPVVGSRRVTMYATSWCGYCRKARDYFRRKGIPYTEYDIEEDRRAKRRYDAMGATGVPVILVGDRRMNGFSESGFERIYR